MRQQLSTKEWEVSKEGLWLLVSAAVVVAVLAAGCGGDLPAASRLERTRVLGARVVVAAEPGRADALPGEAATVEWLVAGPRAPSALAWAFTVCPGIDGTCTEGAGMSVEGTGAPVVAPFTAPPAVDAFHSSLMVGVVCDGGAPALSGAMPGCGSGAASTNIVRFSIPMPVAGEAPNHHPDVSNDTLELDGAAWTALPAGDAGGPCDAAMGLPTIAAGREEVPIRFVTDGDDRELAVPAMGGAPVPEELQLSSFATDGELEGSYQEIPSTDTRPDAAFETWWTPPAVKDLPAGGVVVHFHFVVRDGRGGLDWTHRALCAVAP
jgi:hypothetical protein